MTGALVDDPAAVAAKEDALRHLLGGQSKVLVAYSAGVDSTYLLAMAHAELGDDCIAVTADSPSLARRSLAEAEAFCAARGIRHEIVPTDEFDDERYVANDGLRCYACKAALFRAMQTISMALPDEPGVLLLGALAEDFDDIRPGLQAAREAGAQWPLATVGLTKPEVRWLSERLGLTTWDRPAEPCLSSRLPYGEPVTSAALAQIEAAEDVLRELGFIECRARHHRIGDDRGALCRIEVPDAAFAAVIARRHELDQRLRAIGYHQVSVDLGGLTSGGFNRLLSDAEVAHGRP